MKIVCVSDTHARHRHFTTPPGDVLIHAGDIMNCGYKIGEIKDFNEWLADQPQARKVVIAGNHDRLFESSLRGQELLTNATYLENSGTTINGVTFWGSPAQPEFCNWAFNYKRGEEIARIWSRIPYNIDVLITHGPPFGILDWTKPGNGSLGCQDLKRRVQEIKPKLHVFGHIHGGYGVFGEYDGGTIFANASLLNEAYQPVNRPIVIDLKED